MALCPVIGKLLHKRVVLASASPRRQEILSNAKDLRTPDVVIGADTIVAVDGLVLEKPVDKQDAYHMLSRLSGKEHSVFTGVAIVHCTTADRLLETQVSEFYEETRVTFSELSEDLLWEYIHSGEPMDKAGGYGIQSLGGMLVESVRGDFLNVVGFPLNRFCKQLAQLYYPPRGQDVRRVKHDSIPPVDSFEALGDLDAGHPGPVQSHVDPGAGPGSPGSLRGVSEAEGDSSEASCNRAVSAQPPFPAGLLDLIDGFKVSKALFTACRLKVFDLLSDGAPRGAADVARAVDASVCGTRRLLEVCVALGLLRKTEQGYSNTELAGRHLVSSGGHSLHGLILHSDQRTWDLFSHLERTLREGRPGGAPGDLEGSPCRETQLQALKAEHTLSTLTARRLASAFDLSRFSSACLLGGCRGALAWELARECPRLEVTVLDVPDELQQVSCFQSQDGPAARVSLVPGDPSRDALPAADLYILPRLPPEWPDDKVHQLLRRVAGCCRPGGGLLLAEVALDEDPGAARRGLRQKLDLLVQTPGRDWTLGEGRRLLEQHGFGDMQVAPAGDFPGAVLGIRVRP
ncbi:putative bifunctional dTTP/UTP pyrophosphatase/methyltransferase protein isoform X2 [Urocitellus parryii]